MANERIIQINGGTALTRLRNSSDVMELDNSSSGSAQISVSNIIGGILLDYVTTPVSISTLLSGYTSVYQFSFNTTLSSAPSHIDISIMCTTGTLTTVFGNVVSNLTTTNNFYVALSAPVADGTHTLIWRAYA